MDFCSWRVDWRLRGKQKKWGRLLPTSKALEAPQGTNHVLSDLGQICLLQDCSSYNRVWIWCLLRSLG